MEPDRRPPADDVHEAAEVREEQRRSGMEATAHDGGHPAPVEPLRVDMTSVEPLQVDMTRVVLAGIVAWAVALVVLLLMRDRLAAHGTSWWIWTCVVAIGLGGVGLVYVRRR